MAVRYRSVFLLALLAAIVVAVPHAAVNIIWRSSLLSFDNPATQIIDELTSEKASYADPLFEVSAALRTAATSSRGLAAAERSDHRHSARFGTLEARAPPPFPPSA